MTTEKQSTVQFSKKSTIAKMFISEYFTVLKQFTGPKGSSNPKPTHLKKYNNKKDHRNRCWRPVIMKLLPDIIELFQLFH